MNRGSTFILFENRPRLKSKGSRVGPGWAGLFVKIPPRTYLHIQKKKVGRNVEVRLNEAELNFTSYVPYDTWLSRLGQTNKLTFYFPRFPTGENEPNPVHRFISADFWCVGLIIIHSNLNEFATFYAGL